MKIFLSALEASNDWNGKPLSYFLHKKGIKFLYNLMSYFYLNKQTQVGEFIRDNSEEILIDSGAHSFQKGKTVDWLNYTKEYADFIVKFDKPNVIGYFEMDVDNIIGYEKVLELRKILESVSDKIIPVWHKNRGVEDYKKMCEQYAGKIVAVTGFKNEDIKDEQYLMFLKEAKKYNCKVHCLGMTRKKLLDSVPFDYADSSSWKQQALFGRINGKKVDKDFSRKHRYLVLLESYKEAMKMQEYYHRKWQKVCKD